jgi:hypothetical protein
MPPCVELVLTLDEAAALRQQLAKGMLTVDSQLASVLGKLLMATRREESIAV